MENVHVALQQCADVLWRLKEKVRKQEAAAGDIIRLREQRVQGVGGAGR